MNKNQLTELKNYLQNIVNSCKEDGAMETISWGFQEGVLITGNEAETVIKTIEQHISNQDHINELINSLQGYVDRDDKNIQFSIRHCIPYQVCDYYRSAKSLIKKIKSELK